MSLDVADLFTATFFRGFLIGQGYIGGFILALIVGPPLISSDLANNGMALYFSRPLTRTEYALGKMSILIILLSAVTWVPNLLMFLLKAYMAGEGWILENFRIGAGIFIGSWIGIVTLTLVTLAVSSTTKHKARARLFLFGLFFIVSAFGGIIGEFMRIWWGKMLQLHVMIDVIVCSLIGVDSPAPAVPLWAAWFSILTACGLALLFLRKKIRAYEIVR
jgi:ABC-type transport system involved in multi-copper enzyme maturation permease subunit